MCSGFSKYFQIAPCFRDEDPRADRAPGEFYQLDFEMSFATQEDVFKVVEDVIPYTFKKFTNWKVDEGPFIRIPYREAMEKYGIDKPDLRNPLLIEDLTIILSKAVPKVTGYQIKIYSSKKKAKKNKGAIWTKVVQTNSKKIVIKNKKLKNKKTLYIRIRAYKRINRKNKYSTWSEIKKVIVN